MVEDYDFSVLKMEAAHCIHMLSHIASKYTKKAFFSKSFFSAALTKRLAVLGLILLTSVVTLGLPKTALVFTVS